MKIKKNILVSFVTIALLGLFLVSSSISQAVSSDFDSGWESIFTESALCSDGCGAPCFSWIENCGCSASDFHVDWLQPASSCQGSGFKALCQGGDCNILGDSGFGLTINIPSTGNYFVSVDAAWNDDPPAERMFLGVNSFGSNSNRRLVADLADTPDATRVQCVFKDEFNLNSDPAKVWAEGDTNSGSVDLHAFRISECIPSDITVFCDDGSQVPANHPDSCNFIPPTCSLDSDCGTDGPIGQEFCAVTNNAVLQNHISFTCNNPGTSSASCSNSTLPVFVESCSHGCSNGACLPPPAPVCGNGIIEAGEMCDDGNTNNLDGCSSSCQIEPPIACDLDSDCGTDGPVSGLYCSNDNVVQDFISFTCNNPGIPGNSCSNVTSTQTVESCALGCANGQCNQPPMNGEQINITITSPEDNSVLNTTDNIPLELIIQGSPDACWYSLDGSANITLPSCLNTTFNTTQGTHNLMVFANNSIGETFKETSFFTVTLPTPGTDNEPPVVTLVSPRHNEKERPGLVTLGFNATDSSNITQCQIFNDFSSSFQGSHIITNIVSGQTTISPSFDLSRGTYEWNVECTDEHGNSAFAQNNFTLRVEKSGGGGGGSGSSGSSSFGSFTFNQPPINETVIFNDNSIKLFTAPESQVQEPKVSGWLIFLLIIAVLILIVAIVVVSLD